MPQEVELDLARAERAFFSGDRQRAEYLAGLWLSSARLAELFKMWAEGRHVYDIP